MFKFGIGRKLLFGTAAAGQTSLNNPDFSEFTSQDDSPDGTHGWIEDSDPFDSASISLTQCGYFLLYAGASVGGTGDIVYQNTADMRGGEIYDVVVMAHGFSVPFIFDAYISDVAQGVGGSDVIDDDSLSCAQFFQYGGQIDASSISGTFRFKITIQASVFDTFNIQSINLVKQ